MEITFKPMKAIWEKDYHKKYRYLVIFIPWNIWEEQLTWLGGWNLTTTKPAILSQTMLQVDIKLLMLVLEYKVDYRLKILKGISMECMECLNEDA